MANVLSITQSHDKARVALRGSMSVDMSGSVTSSFSIRFFTTTSEFFNLGSTSYQFRGLDGQLTSGIIFGGKPGLFIELMFNPAQGVWYITANNVVTAAATSTGSGGSNSNPEGTITFSTTAPTTDPTTYTVVNFTTTKSLRGVITAPTKLRNPVGMVAGDSFTMVIIQDATGGRTLGYDTLYAFEESQYPVLSTAPGAVDVLTGYMTSSGWIICNLKKNYGIVTPIAWITGSTFYYDVRTALATAGDLQTVQILRSGAHFEATGTVGTADDGSHNTRRLRIAGVKKNGVVPRLELAHTGAGPDRPAFGKAVINVEQGDTIIQDLALYGATSVDAGNACGVMINPNAKTVLLKNLEIRENENGIRSSIQSEGVGPTYDIEDCWIDNNSHSYVTDPTGPAHNLYAGASPSIRITRTTFENPAEAHNIKSRAWVTEIKQVYTYNAYNGREVDIPNNGIVRATDSYFIKLGGSQNNLIGIGHEGMGGVRPQEYYFINCYFHNDIDPGRGVSYLDNWLGDGTPNTEPVHFIDCLFGGAIKDKGASTFNGPYTITLTGGPLGPRVPAGVAGHLGSILDANAKTNPANIALTPYSSLPAMKALPARPNYESAFPAIQTPPALPTAPTPTPTPPAPTPTPTPPTPTPPAPTPTPTPPAPTPTPTPGVVGGVTMDTATKSAYDTAVAGAAVGNKRLAGATAIVNSMKPDYRLYIYQNGNLMIPAEYSGDLIVGNDGTDVYVTVGTLDTASPIVAGDLSVGTWTFTLGGGASYARTLSGTVGAVGSNANIILSENPQVGMGFDAVIKFVMPRSLDGLV